MDRRIIVATVAFLAVGFFAAISVQAPSGGRPSPIGNFSFLVEIDGMEPILFTEVSGLSCETQAIEFRSGSDPSNYVEWIPGTASCGPVRFVGALTGESSDLGPFEWYNSVAEGKDDRRDISVTLLKPNGDAVRTFNLIDTFPTHFEVLDLDAGEPEVAKLSLTVRVNRIEMA